MHNLLIQFSNLLIFADYVYDNLYNYNQTVCIYTDLSKAFDVVDHDILISKLDSLNLPIPIIAWYRDFLCNRKLLVAINGSLSDPFDMTSGIPQGSCSSSLLWNVYVNDLPDQMEHSQLLLFADDTNIFKTITSDHDFLLLQEDLDNFSSWCQHNKLTVNVSKCAYIVFRRKNSDPLQCNFTLNNVLINKVGSFSDLGVVFDEFLLFDKHVLHVHNRCSRILGLIKRSTKHFSRCDTIRTLYLSLVRSIMMYASVLWRPLAIGDPDLLDSIQRRFLRYISFINVI